MRLHLVEPGLHRDHGLGVQPEDPDPGVVRHPLVGDQPGRQQDPQMPLIAGDDAPVAAANCPARRGPSPSSFTTCRRVGSASTSKNRST